MFRSVMNSHIIHLVLLLFATLKTTESLTDCNDPARGCFHKKSDCVEYDGELSTTLDGYTCQKWNSQSPQTHNGPAYDHNYCRKVASDVPWCYTTDHNQRWDWCFDVCPNDCYAPASGCFYKKDNCAGYGDEQYITLNGYTCQYWNSQSPYTHTKPAYDHNYCRRITSAVPWCYTTDPDNRWDWCFKDCPNEALLFTRNSLTVIKFDPVAKTCKKSMQPNIVDEQISGVSAQNDVIGAFISKETGIYIFNKNYKQVSQLADDSSDYDYFSIGVSREDLILLSAPKENKCQTVNVMSSVGNKVIKSNIAMKTCRFQSFCMGSLRSGDVYIFGGYNNTANTLAASEKYSAATKSMESIADLPVTITQNTPLCLTAEFNGNIMVCDNYAYLDQGCYVYNIEANEWEAVGRFFNDRAMYNLVVIKDELYAIGGTYVDTIEKYNQENKSWEVFMTNIDYFYDQNDFYAFYV